MIEITNVWKAKSRGAPAEVFAFFDRYPPKRRKEAEASVNRVYAICVAAGIDFALAISRIGDETGDLNGPAIFVSAIWAERLNPGGIGVTDGKDELISFANGAAAADAYMAHIMTYLFGPRWVVGSLDYMDDPRYDATPVAWMGSVKTLHDLEGKWFTDPEADENSATRGNKIFPSVPNQDGGSKVIVFGQVKHPVFVDRLIPDSENHAWDDLGQRKVYGICEHSMSGTLEGTDSWFRRGRQSTSLTDYGVGNSTDGPGLDGVIFRWNDPLGRAAKGVSANRGGWANGGSNGLEGDGPLFVRTFGTNGINRFLVSVERSDGGKWNTPWSPKQFESTAQLYAHWFDVAQVPYTEFPLNPNFGIVTYLQHFEFTDKSNNSPDECPGLFVRQNVDRMQDRVRAILKSAQAFRDGDTVPPVKPPAPDHDRFPNGWKLADLARRFGGLPRHYPNGTVTPFPFDPTGPVSNAWVSRAADEGMERVTQLPKPLGWWDLDGDANQQAAIILFDRYWTLYRPSATTTWRWVR